MPVTTQTLQGPDLEALLARVPAELGRGATIVAANKLRSGGIAGFFAKEVFEVVVEVDDHHDHLDHGVDNDDEGAPPSPRRSVPGQPSRPSAPRVSTEAVGFAGVLDRMVRDAGIEDYAPRPVGPALASDLGGASDGAEAADEPFEPLVPTLLPRPSATASGPEAPADPAPAGAMVAPVAVIAAPLAPAPAPPAPLPVPAAAPPAGIDPAWLVRVGLPSDLVLHDGPHHDEPTVELLRLFGQLARPQALPTTKGSVIAVVGARADAIELAEALAEQLGTDVDKVVVATSRGRVAKVDEARRIDSIEVAVEQRRSWRRRRQPTIVAVESPFGRRQGTWATELLDAIEPTMVWGVVEAIRKPEDITDWAARLGGLDALAVNGLGDTTSPAAVLSTGVPVGLLDGEEATPMRWTTILAEHLEVAA